MTKMSVGSSVILKILFGLGCVNVFAFVFGLSVICEAYINKLTGTVPSNLAPKHEGSMTHEGIDQHFADVCREMVSFMESVGYVAVFLLLVAMMIKWFENCLDPDIKGWGNLDLGTVGDWREHLGISYSG